MSNIEFKSIPTFRILDYDKAMTFYINFLGFVIDWEHRFAHEAPVYMQVSKNGLILHLTEMERFKPNGVVYVETKGVNDYHEELVGRSTGTNVPDVEDTPWQTKQMEIEDPFGNLLRFNEIPA